MELFRKLGVKITTKCGLFGSGCIFQTQEKTLIITAYHCICEDNNNRNIDKSGIVISDYKGNTLNVVELYIPKDPNLDFVIIEVQAEEEYEQVVIDYPITDMRYKFFGYPHYLNGEEDEGESLDGYFSEVNGEYHLTLQHTSISDASKDAEDSTLGFSGSGIYSNSNGEYKLLGIVRALRGEGEHGKLRGVNIKSINNFLESIELPLLIPKGLLSFDSYFEKVLVEEDPKKAQVLRKLYTKNLKGITPHLINQLSNEKIAIPYENEVNILNDEIWKGWVRLLLYITLYLKQQIDEKNIQNYVYLDIESTAKNILYYSDAYRVEELLKDLYSSAYDDICEDGIVLINSNKLRYWEVLDKKQLNGIVINIDQIENIGYEKGIDITNPIESKSFIVVPFSYITRSIEEKLNECRSEKPSIIKLEQIFQELIQTIFEEFATLAAERVGV